MLGNPMLDVAIGLVFFYLLLSIIATVVQEFIASFLKLRNKNLQQAIVGLIGEANKKEFFSHPLIFPLFKGDLNAKNDPEEGGPAYIPKRNFALAVLALQAEKAKQTPGTGEAAPTTAAPAFALAEFFVDAASSGGLGGRIRQFDATATDLIDKIQNPVIKTAATTALTSAVGELKTATDVVNTAVTELENLFDSTMARASGWYKENAQRIALVISILLAVLLNADSIYIAQRLWGDEALRNQAVAAAEAFYQSPDVQKQLQSLCRTEGTEITAEQFQKAKECTETEIKATVTQLNLAGYPIGWQHGGQPGQNMLSAVLGFLLTGVAVSLGSSFWFDLLGKFMNVRMTGKRENSDPTPPAPASNGGTS